MPVEAEWGRHDCYCHLFEKNRLEKLKVLKSWKGLEGAKGLRGGRSSRSEFGVWAQERCRRREAMGGCG